ncbi:TonB-dependent receptor [Echinimonas agarilytica]|uniref:TonB-dependent receptor n=1 Tax=Echinimonas agarilytica TaxID=1215918 RepID=A0AA41W9R5_9GAMM|nr:TonB-dependent receptor [Echinimonas agarilytica]MCM2680706.1 TonB-dependent receptor [Echinimonas agarilytica]
MVVAGKQNTKQGSVAVWSGVASVILAISSPSVVAQEVSKALTADEREAVEVIEVSGVRGSLESALNTKRAASSIVDAIDAKDIGALPALDLGEALQVIPGVQVNREGERRTSDINLRGLPGSFVKTTANGQSFATPSRSASAVGSPNPFGSFDASVFDGVTVIKSPTAAHQEGGIAGIVDKKLQRALSKKDGRFLVTAGARYEDLNDSYDQEYKFQASKHLIEDVLAVAFKIGYSDQNFRRDSVLFARKEILNGNVYSDYDTWFADQVAAGNVEPNAVVKASSTMQQLSEQSDGDRMSFTGNIEWQATDELKVGLDLLYTQRDLKDGNFQQVSSEVRNRGANTWYQQQIVPTAGEVPFLTGYNDVDNDDGTTERVPVYALSRVTLENATYVPANRVFGFFEEAKGAFLNFDYVSDDWSLDGIFSTSESENEYNQTGFDFRLQGNKSQNIDPTGITTVIDTGRGNMNNMFMSVDGWDTINYDQPFKAGNPLNLNVGDVSDPRKLDFYVLGRFDNPKRDMDSAELNFHHALDLSIFDDAFALTTVHVGGRFSTETLENNDFSPASGFINHEAIGSHFLTDQIQTETDNAWFNGEIKNALNSQTGWLTLDTEYVSGLLQEGMDEKDTEGFYRLPTGFFGRTERNTDNVLDRWETNFEAEEEITAAYVMTDFYGEVGSIVYNGNVGVRYVDTDITIDGNAQEFYDGNQYRVLPTEFNKSYDHWLPSFNISFELAEDLILRAAASKAIVRPNLRSQTPVLAVNEGEGNVKVDFPKADVDPYEADNYDLSLEWYNTEGSAISVGVFKKNITGLFQQRKICPEPGEQYADQLFQYTGDLDREDFDDGTFNCYQVDEYEQEDGDIVNRTVNANISYNSDDEIEVTGYELAIQQNLSFLPYPWNGFGGVVNYSHVDNETDGEDGLVGISPNSYNVIGYYENDGFSFRLAYNYRDEYSLAGSSNFNGPDQKNVKARGQLDMSASYRIMKGLKIDFRAYNLTDEQRYEYVGENEDNVSRINYDGKTYVASLQYQF